jgi:predicted RNA binding protein YcfA (HicA-like mRNA interferase family)
MSRLPSLSAKQLVTALRRCGFQNDHQRGSHLILRHPISQRRTVVPMHSGDLRRSLVKGILKEAGISEAELHRNL